LSELLTSRSPEPTRDKDGVERPAAKPAALKYDCDASAWLSSCSEPARELARELARLVPGVQCAAAAASASADGLSSGSLADCAALRLRRDQVHARECEGDPCVRMSAVAHSTMRLRGFIYSP
jgi:hypothetical protein